jgi:hypothetical protein
MRVLAFVLVAVLVVALTGCSAMVSSPTVAFITANVKGPVAVGDPQVNSTKVGTAEANAILIIAYGDASIATAARNGGITHIHHVDSQSLGVLGIFAAYQTIVYGD